MIGLQPDSACWGGATANPEVYTHAPIGSGSDSNLTVPAGGATAAPEVYTPALQREGSAGAFAEPAPDCVPTKPPRLTVTIGGATAPTTPASGLHWTYIRQQP